MASEPPQHHGGGRADPASAETAILWLTAGPGCHGDTIVMTAATQPSIENPPDGAILACVWIERVAPRAWARVGAP